jgi:hypothetical protein
VSHAPSTKRYHHPVVRDITLGYESFTPTGDADPVFAVNTAAAGPAARLSAGLA